MDVSVTGFAAHGGGYSKKAGAKKSNYISVVVPAYNVQPYIAECLESILGQADVSLEVIVVDDGSTDETAAVVVSFAERDKRIKFIRQENKGLGPARNTGLQAATGKYVTFVDSDDLVLPGAYARMFESLETSSADFVTGNVLRLSNGRTWVSGLFRELMAQDRVETHISKENKLIWDTVAWNKMFRLKFFRSVVVEFPAVLYEDMYPMCRAHVSARSVNVLSEPVYAWRERPDSSSITQRRSELRNLTDRLLATSQIWTLLSEKAPEILSEFERKQLVNDLPLYIRELERGDDDYCTIACSLFRDILAKFSHSSFRALPVVDRVLYALIQRERLNVNDVIAYCSKRAELDASWIPRRIEGRLYASLPFFDGWNALPRGLFDVTDELPLNASFVSVRALPTGVMVKGHAYISRIPLPDAGSSELQIALANPKTGARLNVRFDKIELPALKEKGGVARYDWAGFEAFVDFAKLSHFTKDNGSWIFEITLEAGGVSRRGGLKVPSNVDIRSTAQIGNTWLNLGRTDSDELIVRAEIGKVWATEITIEQAGCSLEVGSQASIALDSLRLRFDNGKVFDLPLVAGKSLRRVDLPMSSIVSEVASACWAGLRPVDQTKAEHFLKWSRRLDVPDPVIVDGVLVELLESAVGNAYVRFEADGVRVESASLEEGVLRVSGSAAATPKLVLVSTETGIEYRLSSYLLDGKFEATLDLLAVPRSPLSIGTVPLGDYELRRSDGKPANARWMISAQLKIGSATEVKRGLHLVLATDTGGRRLSLRVSNRLRDNERGAQHQKKLQDEIYKPNLLKGTKRQFLFESWYGKRIDCNPLALYRKLRERSRDVEAMFVTENAAVMVPPEVRHVRKWSREYWEALSLSKYIVFNDRLPQDFVKRKGQIVMQTWHGTPLKRIGYDIAAPKFNPDYHTSLKADVDKWDILLSPNLYSTRCFKTAFRFSGNVFETGYPRNDALFSAKSPERRTKLRQAIGAAETDTVFLYAPTWRDNERLGPGRYAFKLALDLDRVTKAHPQAKILVRWHHLTSAKQRFAHNKNVVDASDYANLADLMMASDCLITDYSSIVVDYSLTRKPIIFYVPDLEQYGSEMRGFYMDFSHEVPGALIQTEEELLAAMERQALDRAEKQFEIAYSRWLMKYGSLEDGHASERVLNILDSL